MTVFKYMPHGFLNFDAAMPEAKFCIDIACNLLSELLEL